MPTNEKSFSLHRGTSKNKFLSRACTATGLALALLVSGCAPIQKSSSSLQAKARQFAPAPGRAAVYVIRPNQFVGAGLIVPVFIDHRKFGTLPPKSFLYGEVLPREHVLELAEVSLANSVSKRFQSEAGQCYFFYAKVVLGGFTLEPLADAEGRALALKSTLSGDNIFDRADEIRLDAK